MSETDKTTRKKAIPFQPRIITRLFPDSPTTGRMFLFLSLPEKGDLVECYLSFKAARETINFVEIKLGITGFELDANGDVSPNIDTGYQLADIETQHRGITGSDDPFIVDELIWMEFNDINIARFIPRRGEEGYNSSGFVLMMHFTNEVFDGLLRISNEIEVNATIQMDLT